MSLICVGSKFLCDSLALGLVNACHVSCAVRFSGIRTPRTFLASVSSIVYDFVRDVDVEPAVVRESDLF